jgi:anaphase-promoting complex subunit 11
VCALYPTPFSLPFTRYHGVAKWHWEVADDTCGICRMPFDGCCTDCRLPGDDCPPVWGQCNHAFHMHCILRWIQSQSQESQPPRCCMCRRVWEFRSAHDQEHEHEHEHAQVHEQVQPDNGEGEGESRSGEGEFLLAESDSDLG